MVLSTVSHSRGMGASGYVVMPMVTAPLSATTESWEGFPVLVRIVDRGEPGSRACDVGSMEIYGASVVASDPFELARKLGEVERG